MNQTPGPQPLTKEHPDLYRKSIKGGYWVAFLKLAVNLLGFIRTLVLAHFFYLENLGIISIAMMMMGVLSTFSQTGFEAALIQKKTDIRDYLDTVWTTGVLKGVLLLLILYFTAPLLALIRVPDDKVDLAIMVFRAMSICFLIRGMHNIGIICFQKELDFRKVFILRMTAILSEIALTFVFIYLFHSIWGVIIAHILAESIHCIGSYILSPYRPRLRLEFGKLGELWRFGRWIYGTSILGYLLDVGDKLFVWPYLGLPQLALYEYAYNFSRKPFEQLNAAIRDVMFPAYSKIQDDLPRLREAYYKVLKTTVAIITPMSFMMIFMAPYFVNLFLPERMHTMTPVVQILSIKGYLKLLGSTRVPFFQASGRPDILMHLLWIRVLVLITAVIFLTKMWGIVGTALAATLVNLIVNPITLIIFCNMFQFSIWKCLGQSVLPFMAGALMVVMLFVLRMFVFSDITYVSFFVLLVSGLCFYLVALWGLDSVRDMGYRRIVIEQIRLVTGVFK